MNESILGLAELQEKVNKLDVMHFQALLRNYVEATDSFLELYYFNHLIIEDYFSKLQNEKNCNYNDSIQKTYDRLADEKDWSVREIIIHIPMLYQIYYAVPQHDVSPGVAKEAHTRIKDALKKVGKIELGKYNDLYNDLYSWMVERNDK